MTVTLASLRGEPPIVKVPVAPTRTLLLEALVDAIADATAALGRGDLPAAHTARRRALHLRAALTRTPLPPPWWLNDNAPEATP